MEDRDKAASDLQSAEKIAGEQIPKKKEDSIDGAREGEERADGFYSGEKKEKDSDGKGKKKESKKDTLKKIAKRKGPIGIIFGLLLSVGGMMVGFETMLPTAIEEMIIEKLNSVGISSTVASDAWLDTQLNFGVRDSELQNGKYDYTDDELFGLSPWQVQSLKRENIDVVVVNMNGKDVTTLLYYDDLYDVYISVVGTNYLNDPDYSSSELLNAIKAATNHNKDDIATPVSSSYAISNDRFRIAYTAASKTWRGGNSGWFDNIMDNITAVKLSLNRNRFARYVRTGVKSIDKSFKKMAKRASKDLDDGISSRDFNYEPDSDSEIPSADDFQYDVEKQKTKKIDGEDKVIKYDQDTLITDVEGSDMPIGDAKVKNSALSNIQSALNSKAFKAAAAVAKVGSVACSIVEGIMAIYSVVSAYDQAQSLNLISGFLESSSKNKAGKGEASGYHAYGEELTTKADLKYNYGDDHSVIAKDKTAMESAGMDWLFSDTAINPYDPSVLNVNFQAIMSNVSKVSSYAANMASMFESCGYIKATSAVLDLGVTIVSFIPLVGQAVKVSQVLVKVVKKVALTAGVALALNAIIPYITQGIVNYIIGDFATELFGPDLGNAIASSANKLMGGNGTSGGQSPGSEAAVAAYLNERNEVIAQEAEYQRAIRSPFDITSPYTFLGSMVYSLIPIAFSGGGIMSSLRQVSGLASSAISSMLPTAGAISNEAAIASKGDCSLLEQVGVMGDAYCNPYIITDVSTIRVSPVSVNNIIRNTITDTEIASISASVPGMSEGVRSNMIDPDGTIKDDSDLARYISYCGQRTSPYGVKDGNITQDVTGTGSTVSSIIRMVPILDDLAGAVDGMKEQANMDWISGRACVASETNSAWNNNRWYQRYAENMRLVENMNPGYESNVTALVKEQLGDDPIDDSFEATIARFAGMSKEKVEDTLALIEYYQYVANYDGSERYHFTESEPERPVTDYFDNENIVAESYILTNPIIYADVRNRQTMTI